MLYVKFSWRLWDKKLVHSVVVILDRQSLAEIINDVKCGVRPGLFHPRRSRNSASKAMVTIILPYNGSTRYRIGPTGN